MERGQHLNNQRGPRPGSASQICLGLFHKPLYNSCMRIITGSRVGLYRLHHLRLIATLEAFLDLHSSPATMTSTLDELSMLEITPPSSPKIDTKEHIRHNKTKPVVNLTRKESLPSKFLNKPPEPLYYFEEGLRKIPPYHYTYNTYCKERWRGRTLLDIFVEEFRDRPEEYYVRGSFVLFFLCTQISVK